MIQSTDDLEAWSKREGEARYARRNAALPLAAMGGILSCLLLAGCLRAMRGDSWGVSAWALAASASIPYQLLATALALVTLHDLQRIFVEAPAAMMPMMMRIGIERLGSIVLAGLAILYFGACVIYLRTIRVRRLSDDGRSPPSA